MGTVVSQITSLTIVYAYQRKHQSSTSLASVRGIHRWPVNSPHKWPVTRKMLPLDDVIMSLKIIVSLKVVHKDRIWWWFIMGSDDGLVSSGTKPLTDQCWLISDAYGITRVNALSPGDMWQQFWMCNSQTQFCEWYCKHFLWNCQRTSLKMHQWIVLSMV